YGNTTAVGASDFPCSTAYTGAVNDTATGLIYMNARYYNPATGRFLTQDSYRGGWRNERMVS
ncbi:MAG: RHS repeat-associated core domain-containing protein, partial [Bacillota bacterium]|nr:RHS repeat-associated core domain-containing protein [Bacillota bacterium]